MANFDIAFEKLMKHEGGKSNNPKDSGGKTNFGVTQKSWTSFITSDKTPKVGFPDDVNDLKLSDAEFFYLKEYWIPLKGISIKDQSVVNMLLSFAVNQGLATAVRRLQRILELAADGILGVDTLSKINAADPKKLVNEFLEVTIEAYNALVKLKPDNEAFIKGWNNRVKSYRVA